MRSTGVKYFSLLPTALFFAAVIVRVLMLLFDWSRSAGYFYYGFIALGIILIAADCYKRKEYSNAFSGKNIYHLNFFSYLAAAGFFVDFVSQCVKIFMSVEDSSYRTPTYFIPICLAAFFALLSSFYFVTVGLSYGDRSYDFREFKILHAVPICWSISRFLMILSQAVSFLNDIDEVIKFIVLIFSLCFFYFFASEVENKDSAKPAVLFFARGYASCSVVFFIDRLILIFISKADVFDYDSVFGLAVLLICLFPFFFEKNIISNT